MVLGFNSSKCLNHPWDLYQNLSRYQMRDILLHKASLLGCLPVELDLVALFSSLMCFLQSMIKWHVFMSVVTMKLILVRSSTSYSGTSNIRAGMNSSLFYMIVEIYLTFPLPLISFRIIIIGISGRSSGLISYLFENWCGLQG